MDLLSLLDLVFEDRLFLLELFLFIQHSSLSNLTKYRVQVLTNFLILERIYKFFLLFFDQIDFMILNLNDFFNDLVVYALHIVFYFFIYYTSIGRFNNIINFINLRALVLRTLIIDFINNFLLTFCRLFSFYVLIYILNYIVNARKTVFLNIW